MQEPWRGTAAAMSPVPLTIELDVTDPSACEAAVERVLDEHGRLDVAWANAGIASFGPLQLTDPAAWLRTVDVNLLGVYHTIRSALPAVIAQRGYVAVTASLASFAHAPHMSACCATKAAVEAMLTPCGLRSPSTGSMSGPFTQPGSTPIWCARARARCGPSRSCERRSGPSKRTYPVERAVRDIVGGFEQRRRRICTPSMPRTLCVRC